MFSLSHLLTLSLCVAHTAARDSAATGVLSPSSLHVTERGRVLSDLPPAHTTQPNSAQPPPPHFELHLECTEKENASIEWKQSQWHWGNYKGCWHCFLPFSSYPPPSCSLHHLLGWWRICFLYLSVLLCSGHVPLLMRLLSLQLFRQANFASASTFQPMQNLLPSLPTCLYDCYSLRSPSSTFLNVTALLNSSSEYWEVNYINPPWPYQVVQGYHGMARQSTEQHKWFRINFNNSFLGLGFWRKLPFYFLSSFLKI